MNVRLVFAGVGLLALLAGSLVFSRKTFQLWLGARGPGAPAIEPAQASPAAIQTARFADAAGQTRVLGQFQGQVVVVNFWATWCAPCREEMPGFVRLQSRWKDRGVQFVGLANDERGKVDRFGSDLQINYPLWTGGDEVMDLSRRLGNRLGVLPHTVILDRDGRVLDSRIGLFRETDLEARLVAFTSKRA